jgi:hypothetical protein
MLIRFDYLVAGADRAEQGLPVCFIPYHRVFRAEVDFFDMPFDAPEYDAVVELFRAGTAHWSH